MAFSELVKSFEKIRGYMREFYVYGFRTRSGFAGKSGRTYDNERRRLECGDDGAHVMTIHLDRLPAEGLELRADVIETGYVTNVAVNLQVVVVDDGNEIVKMVVGGEHGRFPDLPLLDFAVAEQREDAAI